MKKIINVSKAATTTDIGLLVARLGIAALMLTHGIPKMIMLFSGAPVQFPPVMGLSAELSLGLAVFAEVFSWLCYKGSNNSADHYHVGSSTVNSWC